MLVDVLLSKGLEAQRVLAFVATELIQSAFVAMEADMPSSM